MCVQQNVSRGFTIGQDPRTVSPPIVMQALLLVLFISVLRMEATIDEDHLVTDFCLSLWNIIPV